MPPVPGDHRRRRTGRRHRACARIHKPVPVLGLVCKMREKEIPGGLLSPVLPVSRASIMTTGPVGSVPICEAGGEMTPKGPDGSSPGLWVSERTTTTVDGLAPYLSTVKLSVVVCVVLPLLPVIVIG